MRGVGGIAFAGRRGVTRVDVGVGVPDDTRGARLVEELAAMRTLAVARLPDYQELVAEVSEWSTMLAPCSMGLHR